MKKRLNGVVEQNYIALYGKSQITFKKETDMKKSLLVLATAGLFGYGMLTNSTAADTLLDNGSFESPAIATNTCQFGTPTSWSWANSVGFIFNGTVFYPPLGSNWPSPQDGSQFVDIGNISSYSLLQSFSITDNGTYQLAWYDNAHEHGLTSPYSVNIIDGELHNIFSVSLDAAHGGIWQKREFLLDLAPGTYTLSFTAQGYSSGYDTLLDNISLTASEINYCAYILAGDLNGDCKEDFEDLKILADQWLLPPGTPSADIAPPPNGDGIANFLDYATMANNWLVDCFEEPSNPACVHK